MSPGTFLIRKLRLKAIIRCLFLCLIPCVCGLDDALAQTYPASWPVDSSWTSYTQFGAVLQDLATATGDQTDGGTGVNPDSADVYNGTSGNLASVYFYYDSSSQVLFFRMRLRGSPQQGGQSELQNGTWNAILDTDGDGYKEFFVELNGNGTDTLNVYYGDTNRQDITSADCSDGEGRVFTISAVMNTHFRITAATGGGFFLDYQAPLSSFDNCGGAQVITTSTPFSFVFTTSATAQNPTQKDLTGPGDYVMVPTSPLPFGDRLTLSGNITQDPVVAGLTHACGGGANFDPITLTASVLDTLTISGTSLIDSIASVTFSYRVSGSSSYTQIAQVNAPVSGTTNTWQTAWSTASIASNTYAIRVVVLDDQGNQVADNSYAIDLSTCTKVAAPTSVEVASFRAIDHGEGRVLLTWETGNEIDNLGFNLYREEKGSRILVNPGLIAGPAFLTAPGVMISAGMSYRWLDAGGVSSKDVQYWLEDIDLNGASSWHGPFAVQTPDPAEAPHSLTDRAPLLGSLAGDSSSAHVAAAKPLERAAQPPTTSARGLSVQSAIASRPAIKIAVDRQGLYRISQPQLLAAGLSPAVDPRNLQMLVDGRQVPVMVRGQDDGKLDPQDYVEFYGIGPDSPYSACRVYWLVSASAPGKRIPLIPGAASAETADGFPYTVERKDKTFFFSSLNNGEAENFFGAVISGSPVLQALRLRNVAAAAKSYSTIEVALQGVTLTPHAVEVSLNGTVIGTLLFSDRERGVLRAEIPQAMLVEGDNVVTLQSQAGNNDVSLVEHIRVTYQHSYRADDDSLQLKAEGGRRIKISGFGGANIRLFDVTDPDDVREVSCLVSKGGGGFAASASVPGQGERVLVFLADSGIRPPVAVTPNFPSQWGQPGNGADLLILSRRGLVDSLKPLALYRQSRGLSVAIVDVEDIYDEFGFGQKSPHAIRDFLAYARGWKRPPRFVLLAGDGTYDPKDYVGGAAADVVPIKLVGTGTMETASDDWYADFDGDGVADIALGRLPVRSPQDVSKITAKIIAFEQGPRFERAALVSDVDRIYDFDAAAQSVRRQMPDGVKVDDVSRGLMGDAAARAKILESIAAGSTLINYIGHGTLQTWNGRLLTAGDAAGLPNGKRPAVFVLMTCLNGLFQNPETDSLAEAMMKADGGAVAVWASTGLTKSNEQVLMNQELVRHLFRHEVSTLGEAVRKAKAHVGDADIRRTWTLFGDPAMRIR